MRAVAVFPAERRVRLIRHEPPKRSTPTHVLLRMLEVGVCGTDKEICAFLYGTPPPSSEYLVIGHESLAHVVEAGPEVKSVKPGDLVVPMVRRPCPHRRSVACQRHRQEFWLTGDFTERGIKQAHGFMTEFVVEEERYLVPVPPSLRDVAVLVEPLTIAEKALMQVWQVQQRLPWACPVVPGQKPGYCHKAVVLGAGPVGLLGAMALLIGGFETWVYSLEPVNSPKADFVKAIGATYVCSATDPVERLAERVGNIDLVYEATGASRISFELMEVLGTNGVFVFTGVPGRKGPIELDADLIMRNLVLKNQVVYGTVNAGRGAFEAAIDDLAKCTARWPQAVRSLITGRYPIDAYQDALLVKVDGIKSTINFALP
ncbi:MAG: glucose 1-dehydrogenase [Candidatus Omnitrophica bacterium]|nr:glucose 1-dehydrogenase [Candidatus Omnitrophota bacterium]